MTIKEIDFSNISKFVNKTNVIYGGGYNGKLLCERLENCGIHVNAFYDDDKSRWGETYCGRKILSHDELIKLDRISTNIIISSMYIGQIVEKIQTIGFANVYAALDMLLQKDTDDFRFYEYKNNTQYITALNQLINTSNDILTKQYYEIIKKTVIEGKATKEICKLYKGEKQYFIKEFRGKLDGLTFLDAGAYTGDTVRELLEERIQPKSVYCFEADPNNYLRLKKWAESEASIDIYCENYALWDRAEKLAMKFANYNARIDSDSESGTVNSIRIDDYFRDIKVDFIKMDIEGAERRALSGGMQIIKRDRPILAISIYHGLEDMIEIPQMLMKELENYSYLVRHHSYTYSETVMYAAPKELNSL